MINLLNLPPILFQMHDINGNMPYLTKYTLHCFVLYAYYCQTYIAPLYIIYIYSD